MFGGFLNRISSAFTTKIISSLDNILVGLRTISENFSALMKFLMDAHEEPEALVCDYENNDEEKIYSGFSVRINDYITIRQPSVDEIIKYGANQYYGMVYTLCSVGADLKWQLDDMGKDYMEVDDFELFYSVLARGFNVDKTKILFGNKIDFSQMQVMYNKEIDAPVMIQLLDNGELIQIDKYTYSCIVGTLRKIHRLKRNDETPGNEATKQILIEDAREEYEQNIGKPQKPYLLPLISTLVTSFGGNRDAVLSLNIYAFVDAVARLGKIKNADLLLSSGYSGFGIDLKKINKEETNWKGSLE